MEMNNVTSMSRSGKDTVGRRRRRSSHGLQPGHCAPLRREGPCQLVVGDPSGMTTRSGEGERNEESR